MRKYLDFRCKSLLGVLLLISLSTGTFAQKTIVRGSVLDAATKEPLPFVNLVFQDSKVGTSTDIDGKFVLETYYPTDSLEARFIGYKNLAKAVKSDIDQTINFELESGEVKIKEVVIEYTGNPAHDILEKVWRNKEANNREKYDYYHYEVYNKVEFDINNITEEFKNRKVFKNFQFIFDYVDSTSAEKQFLPMFMTESLSDYYYQRDPKSEREYIKASQVSGTSNESITQFLGDMYQNVNIYDNNISVFGKSFISPISNSGLHYYRYYIQDTVIIDNRSCYEIKFIPKHKQDPVFDGVMWIHDTTYAVKKVTANISANANINFINGFEVTQNYKLVEDQFWMLEKDELVVDFQIGEKIMGLYGRKSTSYKDFIINEKLEDKYYQGIDNVIVLEGANDKGQEFWDSKRHDTLTASQQGIYEMVDSVKNVPAFKTFVDVVQLVFTGYKVIGNFEIGPYFKLYSFNPVEGHRFRFGGRTSNQFSTRLMLNGYGAYGFTDKRFKYGGGFIYKLDDNPRQIVEMQYTNDLEQFGQSQNAFAEDNILSSFLRRNPNDKLTGVESFEAAYTREWVSGFTTKFFLNQRSIRPLGTLEYLRFDPEIGVFNDNRINTSELSMYTRFAYKEKFVEGEFDRISLGSRYPILEAQLSFGVRDLLQGDYNYQKLELAVTDKFNTGIYGFSDYRITAGKFFGTLPYPLLEIHNGNETYFYDQQAFNLMNFFEFISDEYASIMYTHHFDGYFFNKVPLLRKLKWREVVSTRAVVGNLSEDNRAEMILPNNIFELDEPYMEVAAGVENIFKLIRIDAMWRLNYLDNPNIAKFGIRGAFEFTF